MLMASLLAPIPPMLADVTAYLIVTAAVAMIIAPATKDLGSRVTLLGRRVAVVIDDLLKDGQEGAEDGRGTAGPGGAAAPRAGRSCGRSGS